jgi:hypothetical protein
VPVVVERPFETASDVMTGTIARLRNHLGRSKAPAARTANEEEVVVQLSANGLELADPMLNETRIHGTVKYRSRLGSVAPSATRFKSFCPMASLNSLSLAESRKESTASQRGRDPRACATASGDPCIGHSDKNARMWTDGKTPSRAGVAVLYPTCLCNLERNPL